MPTVEHFLSEINELFGFYFDIGMACHLAKGRLEKVQSEHGANDESPFMYKDGPAEKSPEEEMQNSLHATTIGALKARMEKDGFDTRKAAESAIVFTFHIWEEKYRRNLVTRDGTVEAEARSDIMGDLRLLRNSIIHNKGIADDDVVRCKVMTRFRPGHPIELCQADIYAIIHAIRAEFGPHA